MELNIQLIIDRFEEGFAVCEREDKVMINIKKELLPEGAEEGQVILIKEEGIVIDYEETKRRKKEIEEATKELWK